MDGQNNRKVKKTWCKILYERQPYPDNYVPPIFLEDLRTNVNLKHYQLNKVVIESGLVSQGISVVVIFIAVYGLFYFGNESESQYISFYIFITTLLLYIIQFMLSSWANVYKDIRTGFIFITSGFFVSPILKTLTETISTDSIYAMVAVMFIVHLAFYDYGVDVAMVSPSLSLNAAIFGAVCLASRLRNVYHVFALLILSSDLFVILSSIRRKLHETGVPFIQVLVTFILNIGSLFGIYRIVPLLLFILYVLLLNLVNFIFPFGFYRWQGHKRNIYGPWDEAIINKRS